MKREAECAEVIARLDFREQRAHICVSAWPRMARRMAKLYGPSLDGPKTERAARWTVPLKCVSFRKPSSKPGGPAKPIKPRKAAPESRENTLF
jgi:hypothetical protein